MEELGGDLAEFGKKTQHIMIFLPHYMWVENNKYNHKYEVESFLHYLQIYISSAQQSVTIFYHLIPIVAISLLFNTVFHDTQTFDASLFC